MESANRKRPYNSTRRKEQARRQTRRQIVEAARKMFIERSYAGTSIEAISQEAGVAVETVYASFGNKRSILTALVDVSVGDDQPIPLLQRPDILAARQETDQLSLIRAFVNNIYKIMERMSPIFALLRMAAKTEPEIATLLDRLLKERLQGMAFLVDNLIRISPLRAGLNPAEAAETIWAITSAELFQLLNVDLHWTQEQYKKWLEVTLVKLLLP